MEPNNVEKQIREKLNAREIQPAAHSWDRLDAMLSVQEESSKKRGFPWMKIAAGLVLFLGIGYVFLMQNESQEQPFQNNQEVVESPKAEETKLNNKNSEVIGTEINSNTVISKETRIAENSKSKGKQDVKPKQMKYPVEVIQQERTNKIAEANTEKTNEISNGVVTTEKVLPIVNKDVIAENKTISKPKLKVDANALLNQVEGEVILTFRQKVMKSMVKNYKDAKESFASRNLEESSNNQ
ncbi:hypothetical protein EQG63_01600 [Flavobacterium amnicola]|uniref:Uncharacterized protein n=1 Tax=Flavobacterium amnicola TaxID=2506422 RepID=A0A4Q1K485_9FLAO|nr:hypothetical protein [Flavobacterium amnicola]RXR20653.1 hypothetical protein EQG63_01600 [Flavobacterium amnicola]